MVSPFNFMAGYSSAVKTQASFSRAKILNYDIGSSAVNTPAIFEPPPSIATNQVWIGLSSQSPYWGGAAVWISTTGDSYAQLGAVRQQATMGVLTAQLDPGDPVDVTNVLSVDLSQSYGTLVSVSASDALSLATLCWVADDTPCALGEFLSYTDATLTAPNEYDLTGLYRGQWSSANEVHAADKILCFLNGAIAKFPYDPALVGQTVYFKFPSVNYVGGGGQTLAQTAAYPFTLTGGQNMAFPVWLPFTFSAGTPAASEVVPFTSPGAVAFQPNFASDGGYVSIGRAAVAATASTTFNVQKAVAASPNVWATIGTVVYALGAVIPTFTTSGGAAQSLAVGDTLRIQAPAVPDATLAGVAITLVGHRS